VGVACIVSSTRAAKTHPHLLLRTNPLPSLHTPTSHCTLSPPQRFVDDCVLELRGGSLQVRLAQAPSASVAAKQAAKGAGAGGGGGGGGRAGGGGPGAAAAGSGRGGGGGGGSSSKGGKGGGGGKAPQQPQDLDKASDPALTGEGLR
jgi:hypothetical protein